jgi:broad specificity phosphatase PhoE
MKHLFVARHADYGADKIINDSGREQIELLAKAMKEILKNSLTYIISSTARRALDSSQLLMVQLALPKIDYIPYLWAGEDGPRDNYNKDSNNEKLMQFVNERRNKADCLIMMTHLDITDKFPNYFLKKEFDQNRRIEGITKGKAAHFDIEKRLYQIIPK